MHFKSVLFSCFVAEFRLAAALITLSLLLPTDSPKWPDGYGWLCFLPSQAGREEEQTARGGIQVKCIKI